MFESLFEALQMSFMQRALAATLAMSLLCPVMGLFLVLRRSSMTGDALSHSSLAGAAAALALGQPGRGDLRFHSRVRSHD